MNEMSVPISIWSMAYRLGFSKAEPLDAATAQHAAEDHPGEQHRREHVGDEPDAQRHRESLDRSGAELEQEEGADERGQVGIQDRAEGAVVAEIDRLTHAWLVAQLIADAFEDKHGG